MPEIRVVNKHIERGTKYIGRGSGFGNPYEIGKDGTRDEVCYKHEMWLRAWIEDKTEIIIRGYSNKWVVEHLKDLQGEIIECFCKPKRCHGDTLVRLTMELLNVE